MEVGCGLRGVFGGVGVVAALVCLNGGSVRAGEGAGVYLPGVWTGEIPKRRAPDSVVHLGKAPRTRVVGVLEGLVEALRANLLMLQRHWGHHQGYLAPHHLREWRLGCDRR